jgi:hypothetical protein
MHQCRLAGVVPLQVSFSETGGTCPTTMEFHGTPPRNEQLFLVVGGFYMRVIDLTVNGRMYMRLRYALSASHAIPVKNETSRTVPVADWSNTVWKAIDY